MMAGAIAGLFMVAMLPLCAHASAAGGVAGTAAAGERRDPHGLDARPAGGAVLRLRGGKTGGIKARDIWTKPLEELSQMEEDLRLELMSLRVAQQVGGQPGRVNQIKKVRKSIARVLTVATAKRRAEAFESVKNDKFKPLDARKNRNLPKAMRQRLNKYERTRMSNKAVRCLRLKIWGAGVRPMRRIVLSGPLEEVSTQPARKDTRRHALDTRRHALDTRRHALDTRRHALCLLLSIPSLKNHALRGQCGGR